MSGAVLRARAWWAKSLAAGLIGGAAMAVHLMLSSALEGRGFFMPFHYFAALFEILQPPSRFFDPPAFVAGLLLHIAVAALIGLASGAVYGLAPGFLGGAWRSAFAGLAQGVLIWMFIGIGLAPVANPDVLRISPGDFLVAHVVYGVAASLALHLLARSRELRRWREIPPGSSAQELGLRHG
jgi:hypothetical protein